MKQVTSDIRYSGSSSKSLLASVETRMYLGMVSPSVGHSVFNPLFILYPLSLPSVIYSAYSPS